MPKCPATSDIWLDVFHNKIPAFAFVDTDIQKTISSLHSWPAVSQYQEIFPQAPYAFQEQHTCDLNTHDGYEGHIHNLHTIPTRNKNWHDFFNAMIWHHFPQSKTLLNQQQTIENKNQQDQRNCRTSSQNLLTRFDESGAVCILPPKRAQALRDKDWKAFFLLDRQQLDKQLQEAQIFVCGHGLFEKCINPYIGLCAHALIIESAHGIATERIDHVIAQVLGKPFTLHPLPLLGLPGWHVDNESEIFYGNTSYFR